MLYFFRRRRGVYKENQSVKDGIVYSPSSGKVIKINSLESHSLFGNDLNKVQIRVPWHKDYGIYLPYTSEVKDLRTITGKDFFRYSKWATLDLKSKSGVLIALKNQKGDEIGLQLVKCVAGLWPEIKVMPGDRGKRQANIGLLPLGGTLILYIPKKYEILVHEGQEVVAGESLIAGQY